MKYLRVVATVCIAAAACGRDIPPSTLKGQSSHFRLFVDNSLVLPSTLTVKDALNALETNWNDTRAVFAMPDKTVIDYYLLTEDHISSACLSDAGGCFAAPAVYSPALPDQHELNHAYNYARMHHYPLPMITEGAAEAVGCEPGGGPPINKSVPWRQVAAETGGRDIYEQGKQLVRHLIVAQGADAFVRYYDQVPEAANADTFGVNFQEFWGRSLDDVWAEMHTLHPEDVAATYSVCPCTLPQVPTDGTEVPFDNLKHPYFTLPDSMGGTFSLAVQPNFGISVYDCDRSTTAVGGTGSMLARLGARDFVSPSGDLTAAVGSFVTDTCDAAAVYDLPDYVEPGNLTIIVARPDTGEVSVY